MENFKKKLNELNKQINAFKPRYPTDKFVLIALKEAIQAVKEGNFGVGAVLVKNNKVIQRGHNRVFKPYFRSDLHAEMDVLTKFEKRYKKLKKLKGFILYTSIEPCPMCLARLIASRINKIYYVAEDETGGMVRKFNDMPSDWINLSKRQEFSLVKCSPELKQLALEIFKMTVDKNKKLQKRSG